MTDTDTRPGPCGGTCAEREAARADRDRWQAQAERLRERACWTPQLRADVAAARDKVITVAASLARWGRGAAAADLRAGLDVLTRAIGRLEMERDEARARADALAGRRLEWPASPAGEETDHA